MIGMRTHDPGSTRSRLCALCADVVGVYEPAVFVLGDGSVLSGSRLTVDQAAEIVETYHQGCSPPAMGGP